MLYTRDLVPVGPVIIGDFRFNDDLRVVLAGDYEIGGLIEVGNPLRAARLAITNTGPRQHVFNGGFHIISDELAYRVAMPSERSSEKPFIQNHGIRDAKAG